MILDIYNRVSQLTKSGTSGYIDQDEFNGIIAARQLTLADMIIDKTGENNKANDAVSWLKLAVSLTSDSSGELTMPDDYLRLDSMSLVVGGKPYRMQELQTDQLDTVRVDTVIGPNLATNDAYYYYLGGTWYVMPEQVLSTLTRYYKVPPAASIVLTPSEDGNDYLTPTVGTELGWPASTLNLWVYLVMLDYGVEMKEEAIMEFAKYGIDWEMIKNQPQ